MRRDIELWRNPFRPFRELTSLQRAMDRMFDQFFTELPTTQFRGDVDFVPSCDMGETEDHYLICLDIPGISKENLQVELSGSTLSVSGEQREEKKEEKGAQRYFERFHGRFARSFTLPGAGDPQAVEADYKDGVLRIAVPKAATAKTHRIKIGEGKGGIWSRFLGKAEEKKETKAA